MQPYFLQEFLSLALLHFIALVSPGSDFVVVTHQSVTYGEKNGMMTSVGIGVGLALHALYTLLGFSLLLSQSENAYFIAKIAGAGYLAYLGISLMHSSSNEVSSRDQQKPSVMSGKKSFIIGFMTNALNPKITIFFLAIYSVVIHPQTPLILQIFYCFWMCFTSTIWFIFVTFLLSRPKIRTSFLKNRHWFEKSIGTILIIMAIYLIVNN